MGLMTTRRDFTYKGWDCWYHPLQGWGAILSRKVERPIIINGCVTREELITKINVPEPSEFRHTAH
jgi:hypothetical protein